MGTHDLHFLCNFLQIFFFFTSLISLMVTSSAEYFIVVSSLVMASCGFVAVTVTYCCQNLSEIWSNAKIQKLQIFSVVLTSFDSFISECQFDHANCGQLQIFASILSSSFYRGDLCVFDFFGNTHRKAYTRD